MVSVEIDRMVSDYFHVVPIDKIHKVEFLFFVLFLEIILHYAKINFDKL